MDPPLPFVKQTADALALDPQSRSISIYLKSFVTHIPVDFTPFVSKTIRIASSSGKTILALSERRPLNLVSCLRVRKFVACTVHSVRVASFHSTSRMLLAYTSSRTQRYCCCS